MFGMKLLRGKFQEALSDSTREIEICSDGREALVAFERRAADVGVDGTNHGRLRAHGSRLTRAHGSWLWALGSGLWALGFGLWALGSRGLRR